MPDLALCKGCFDDLPRPRSACRHCALPLVGTTQAVCGQCQQRPPAFSQTRTALRYRYPVPYLVQQFKFAGRLEHGRLLAELLARELSHDLAMLPDLIVPVPLHPRRLRQRGFNQAAFLARTCSTRLGIPVDWRHWRRTRATDPQSELDEKARRDNVRDAFACSGALEGARIALVDDVMTSGSTVGELARCALQAGAGSVQIWVCARA